MNLGHGVGTVAERIQQTKFTGVQREFEVARGIAQGAEGSYEGTVSVVLDMIRLLESQFEDIPSSGFNPEIEAMRNAVRCADYDSAIVLAEAYYQSRQVPSGDESQQRLIDIASERLQPAAS